MSDEAVSDEEGISSSDNDVECSFAKEDKESGFFRLLSVMIGKEECVVG